MPLFERSKLSIEVTFSAPTFVAGQVLSGCAKLRVQEPVQLRGLRATHVVVEDVRRLKRREERALPLGDSAKIVHARKSHEAEVYLVRPVPGQTHLFPAGEYSYPFSIAIPADVAPSMALTPMGGKRLGALVQHTLRVDAEIAGALFNFSESIPLRVVNACPADQYCAARPQAVEQHAAAHSFMGVLPSFARTFPSATMAAEQSDFRLTLPRPVVSLADDAFIPFQVTGSIPCRYQVTLHRTCTLLHKRRVRTVSAVVASTVMPALIPGTTVDGTLPIDATKLRGIVTFSGQSISGVAYHMSVHPVYEHGLFVDVDEKLRAKVPLRIVPSLVNAHVQQLQQQQQQQQPEQHCAASDHLCAAPMRDYGASQPVIGQIVAEAKCAA